MVSTRAEGTERLETLRTVLLQVQNAGVDNVANTVRQAIHLEKKKMRDAARVSAPGRRAFAEAEEDAAGGRVNNFGSRPPFGPAEAGLACERGSNP